MCAELTTMFNKHFLGLKASGMPPNETDLVWVPTDFEEPVQPIANNPIDYPAVNQPADDDNMVEL